MATRTDARLLSAKYKDDFAYPTVKDRIPIIVTKIIDQACRMKSEAKEIYGETATEDLKLIAGRLSKLKNEIQTDKNIIPIEDNWKDRGVWNKYLVQAIEENNGIIPSWFKSPWLYVECYFYRRVYETFQLCSVMKGFDPFMAQKCEGFKASEPALSGLVKFLLNTVDEAQDRQSLKTHFKTFIQVSLWGNKCDLSISAGAENHQKVDPMASLNTLQHFILVNHMDDLWQLISKLNVNNPGTSRLGIIIDNAGFEFITDLCLAEFLVSTSLVERVDFYPKAFPWFVSDVTMQDVKWTVEQLVSSSDESLASFGMRVKERMESGAFTFQEHDFWTYPHDFRQMSQVAPDLYAKLAEVQLLIFKGDLNYRKLTGDRKWDPTTAFELALAGFCPAPLCALRTLKADTVVGLRGGQAQEVAKNSDKWMISGEYAVIQLCNTCET